MSLVTVLTPTYNRRELLNTLYKSLLKQSDKDFEWVIVDDGSNDGTGEFIESIIHNTEICIKYYAKPNGGKHTALNYGINKIDSILTFIVDSDDYLTEDAIAKIKEKYELYKTESDLCGFSFLRGKPNGGYLSDSGVPEDGLKESFVECRINRNIGGDMAEVWYTDCLKECPFPEYEGERFLGEDVVWVLLAKKYKLRFFNSVIYISDYLEDGLTNNRRKHNILSPRGCVKRAEVFLEADTNIKIRIKSMLQYQIYGKFAGISMSALFKNTKRKILFVVVSVPAQMLYYKWKSVFQKG